MDSNSDSGGSVEELERQMREAVASGDAERIEAAAEALRQAFRGSEAASRALAEPVHTLLLSAAAAATATATAAVKQPIRAAALAVLGEAGDADEGALVAAAEGLSGEAPLDVAAAAASVVRAAVAKRPQPPSAAVVAALRRAADSGVVGCLRVCEVVRDWGGVLWEHCGGDGGKASATEWTREFVGRRLAGMLAEGRRATADVAAVLNAAEILAEGVWHEAPAAECVAALVALCRLPLAAAEALVACAAARTLGAIATRGGAALACVLEHGGIAALSAIIAAHCEDERGGGNRCGTPDVVAAAISAFAAAGSSGPAALTSIDTASSGTVEQIAELAHSSSSRGQSGAVWMAAIHGIAEMLAVDESGAVVFAKLQPTPADVVKSAVAAVRSPIEDKAVGGLHVLGGVVRHGWGLGAVAATAGALETLVDRTLFATALGHGGGGGSDGAAVVRRLREWRFGIVRTAAEHPRSSDIVGKEWHARLVRFVQQGPHYVPPRATVDWRRAGADR